METRTNDDWWRLDRESETEEEWGSLIAEQARESDGRERGKESVQGERVSE